jgi:hypothetical protein
MDVQTQDSDQETVVLELPTQWTPHKTMTCFLDILAIIAILAILALVGYCGMLVSGHS